MYYDPALNVTESASVYVARPLLIEFGQAGPDARILSQNATYWESYLPFDGFVVRVHKNQYAGRYGDTQDPSVDPSKWGISWRAFGSTWIYAYEYSNAIGDLQSAHAQMHKFKHNFLLLTCLPEFDFRMDWFDDAHWAVVLHNLGVLANIAYQGGCKGIFFDVEQYGWPGMSMWDFGILRQHFSGRPQDFDSWRTKAKQRGQEVIQAMNASFPGIEIVLLFGPCAIQWGMAGYYPAQLSAYDPPQGVDYSGVRYALVMPFIDGMLLSKDTETEIIDGYELSYYYKEQWEFDVAKDVVHNKCKSYSQHPELYEEEIRLALGLWPTRYSDGQEFTPAELTASVAMAMQSSDKYVWIWDEKATYWIQGGPSGVPLVPDYAMINSSGQLTVPGTVENAMRPEYYGMPQEMIDALEAGKQQGLP